MPDLVCIWCGKPGFASSKYKQAFGCLCQFASLKNDDDYDSDNKELMPVPDDDDFYIKTINSDSEFNNSVDIIPYQKKDDDSDNETLHEKPKGDSDDEEEQFDFDEWFGEQMDIIGMDQRNLLVEKIIL